MMTFKKTFFIVLLFALVSGVLQCLPVPLQHMLHYQAGQMPAHFFYLWLTPHLIHLSPSHYLINIASLAVVLLTFRTFFTPVRFFLLFAFSAASVTLGLWCCSPGVTDYVGMSGVIYGILSAGLLWSAKKHPLLSWTAFTLIAGKVVLETFYGPHLSIQASLGETVIVDAHLYGFLSGILFTCFTLFYFKVYPRYISTH